ncbi:MAG: hypothetical protein ACKO81_01175 [Planctomycetota bacterium]
MFELEVENRDTRDEKETEKFFRWPPVLFSNFLTAVAIGLWLFGEGLWSEWMLLINSVLLGWMLAWGPGQLWQRLLMTAALASESLFALAVGANSLGADLEWLYPFTRAPATLISALVLGKVFSVAGRLLGFRPIWGGNANAQDNRWGIAEWLTMTALLAFSLACLNYVVETVVEKKLPVWQFMQVPDRGYEWYECWLLLLPQVFFFAIFGFLLTLFIYLPVTSFLVRGALDGLPVRSRLWQLANYTAGWCIPFFLWITISTSVVPAIEITAMVFAMVFALAFFIESFRDLTWKSTRVSS